ncbi:unnamed protein product [Clonostachys byssicola]|uniref:Uncharacterized protein n=1 Tax=Clonostachys byssicola TaxID=160290 RepID=A0A9N9UTX4_9HYPO|nr:unnamed protein product [Clonostachys byssicola]
MSVEIVLRLLEAGMFAPLEMRPASNDLPKHAEVHIAISSDIGVRLHVWKNSFFLLCMTECYLINESNAETCSDVQGAGAGPPLSIVKIGIAYVGVCT